ncbi:hypothetical protein GCM10009601_07860 [Streptomyces thermospinosisporus]|uniref:GNAT family N-acetyltransferase n=1 Tax=Streptomyces thermospinosisporus TaxID=161482 RepID=A0ABN1YKV5_9ACTN
MSIDVRPATVFEDVRAVLGPKSPTANVCWCLGYRIPSKLNNELSGPARGEYVRQLCAAQPPPGVLAYDGEEPVGWAAVARVPRPPSPATARSRTSTTCRCGPCGASASAPGTASRASPMR